MSEARVGSDDHGSHDEGDIELLEVHRGVRSSTLAAGLANLLGTPLADPFTTEIVAVPAKGVERWLNQRLATTLGAVAHDGIAANIDFPTPAALTSRAISTVCGVDPDDDPWSGSRVLWATLSVIDASLGEPWCAVLARHLGGGRGDHRAGRRWTTAAHVADLFRTYGSARPAMLVDWAQGTDSDGLGALLSPDLLWQARLWRALREHIGSPSPSERLTESCAAIRADPGVLDLPERLSIFGPTRLTTEQLEVLAAIASGREVHLWLPHPSAAMWDTLNAGPIVARRAADDTALRVRHPLLVGLARDVRELQSRLRGLDVPVRDRALTGPVPPPTLLGRIQSDIESDRVPSGGVRSDGTVQVHSCHGAPRQVEVLRESLLHLFAEDPTLEPRDVLIMCPDVDAYAPLIRAAFGQAGLGHPGHRLRVRLADRGLRQTNPLLATVSTLLHLAGGRATASQVLDLAASLPVRERFRFTDDDLERLREWTQAAGARWGINKRQRDNFGLGDYRQNTFNTALDRILLGVAADETDNAWLDLALPLDDVDGGDIDLAGRFAEFVDRLAVMLRDLEGPHRTAEWVRVLTRGLDFLTEVPQSDSWQIAGAHRELTEATADGGDTELRLADVRAMLASRLSGRPTRANFRTGELTVCTMVPMRSVPHRVVVLLGLDDEIFPRAGSVDGDDVLARDPALGERDLRSEDRQLLLDAVMSAQEKLLLFYTGSDPVSGAPKPPAIPLSELLDVIELTCGATIVRRHPLQPFDVRNFEFGRPFSYDRGALAGALADQQPPIQAPAFLPEPLPARPAADIDLADLVSFVEHPTQAFLRQRLGVRVPEIDDDLADALDIELDGLNKWDIGDRMLNARLTGTEVGDFRAAEWRRGTLPPFGIGETQLGDITRAVDALFDVSTDIHAGAADTIDVSVELGDGRRLTGTVTGVHGTVIARTSYSRLAPKHRLAAWVRLLALAAQDDSRGWTAVTTGRGKGGRAAWRSTLTPPPDPIAQLLVLVDLRDRGLELPLPIATGASAVYAERRLRGTPATEAYDAAEQQWTDKFGDIVDRNIVYLYGKGARLNDLPGRSGGTVADAEPTWFGELACTLWRPLLESETEGRP